MDVIKLVKHNDLSKFEFEEYHKAAHDEMTESFHLFNLFLPLERNGNSLIRFTTTYSFPYQKQIIIFIMRTNEININRL